MNRMRQRIAQRLKDAQNTCAMLTTFNEVDMRYCKSLQSVAVLMQAKSSNMLFFIKGALPLSVKKIP